MIWLFFEEMAAAWVASNARDEGDATRATTRAEAYTGPQRRRTDAIDVEARVVPDAPLLEAEP
jgi:hypothetical protein